jgi:hypothetical protein
VLDRTRRVLSRLLISFFCRLKARKPTLFKRMYASKKKRLTKIMLFSGLVNITSKLIKIKLPKKMAKGSLTLGGRMFTSAF